MANAGIFATAGAKIFIGAALAAKGTDFVLGDFAGQSWIEITWAENLGQFGDESQSVTFDAIGQNRRIKKKGSRDAGEMQAVFGIDYLDAGQIALRAAERTPNDYAFKVEFNDATITPSQRYFIAQIMSVREALDGANNIMKLNGTLGINSNIVAVAAT